MRDDQHSGLKFRIGDIVIPVKKFHPIMLRKNAYEWMSDWETCPSWPIGTSGVILEIKVDMDSIGQVMIKIMTPSGTGWTDWWNVSHAFEE